MVIAGDDVARIAKAVGDVAEQVAWVRGPEDRQHQIGAVGNAPCRQRDPEIVGVVGDADLGADIDQSADPDRRVDQKPPQRVAGQIHPALQHVVGEDDRRVQVLQEIVHRVAHRRRQHRAVGVRHRHQDRPVDPLVEVEDRPVGVLERVAASSAAAAGACAAAGRAVPRPMTARLAAAASAGRKKLVWRRNIEALASKWLTAPRDNDEKRAPAASAPSRYMGIMRKNR